MTPHSASISATTRALHWTIAAGVIGMIAFGTYIGGMERGPEKTELLNIHKSFGVLIGLLALTRIVVRIREGFPPAASVRSWWETALSRGAHQALLFATIAMPLSGIAKSVTNARPVDVFGIPVLPADLMIKNESLNEAFSVVHTGLAWAVAGLVVLHVAGALKHHFIDRDDTLRRMAGI